MTATLTPTTSPETGTEDAAPTRSSPKTGTVFATGRPFWIVDGKAYDFSAWIEKHPGGATWFTQTIGRDISALLHTYHPEPAGLQKMLARFEIKDPEVSEAPVDETEEAAPPAPPAPTPNDILPKLGVPPFLLSPDFDARTDLPHLDYRDEGSLLAEIRRTVFSAVSRKKMRRWDRIFDGVTWAIGLGHIATLVLLIAGVLPAWAFVVITVLTRTALAGAGHYQVHRKWRRKPKGRRPGLPLAKALFDINYVGTSLIGTDGHVLLHHPYMGSGADVKKTFFDAMLRLHPLLRIPGYTIHKLGIALTGLSMRGREIAQFERPPGSQPGEHNDAKEQRRNDQARREAEGEQPSDDKKTNKRRTKQQKKKATDASRVDFWLVRALLLIELGLCLATGHLLAWFVQFFITLWVNTFLVVSSHDFEEAKNDEDELAGLPEHLRNDWAAQQIWLSYDLSVVGNRWIDLFLSAGLSPHRVHHVLPWQGSGFANLVSEAAVREACERAGIPWQRPKNLIFNRFPKVIKHYLFCPAKTAPPRTAAPPPPPLGTGQAPPPQPGAGQAPPPQLGAGQGPPPPNGMPQNGMPPGPPAQGVPPQPVPPEPPAVSRMSVRSQLREFVSYAAGGFRGVGV
jgi:hypothetical protein